MQLKYGEKKYFQNYTYAFLVTPSVELIVTDGKTTFVEGEELSIGCRATGFPVPNVILEKVKIIILVAISLRLSRHSLQVYVKIFVKI